MLGHYLAIGLAALLAVGIATGASAAEDNPDTKQCGGYYACVEFQPPKPLPVICRVKFSPADTGSTLR